MTTHKWTYPSSSNTSGSNYLYDPKSYSDGATFIAGDTLLFGSGNQSLDDSGAQAAGLVLLTDGTYSFSGSNYSLSLSFITGTGDSQINVLDGSNINLTTLAPTFTNSGAITVNKSAFTDTATNTGTFVNDGTILSENGQFLFVGKTFTNNGDIIGNDGNTSIDSALINNEDITINEGYFGTFSIQNNGSLTISGALALIHGDVDNVAGATITLADQTDFEISSSNGTFINDGAIHVTGNTTLSVITAGNYAGENASSASVSGTGTFAINDGGTVYISTHTLNVKTFDLSQNAYLQLQSQNTQADITATAYSIFEYTGMTQDSVSTASGTPTGQFAGSIRLTNSAAVISAYTGVSGSITFADNNDAYGRWSSNYTDRDIGYIGPLYYTYPFSDDYGSISELAFAPDRNFDSITDEFDLQKMPINGFATGDLITLQAGAMSRISVSWTYTAENGLLSLYSGDRNFANLTIFGQTALTASDFRISLYLDIDTGETFAPGAVAIQLASSAEPDPYYDDPDDPDTIIVFSCFLENVPISTTLGDIPVRRLWEMQEKGDALPSLIPAHSISGHHPLPVRKIVKGHVSATLASREPPLRIRAGAFAPSIPSEDILLTGEHCVAIDAIDAIDAMLVPIRMLRNDASIRTELLPDGYDIYHIETEQHAIISAAGLPVETWLDHDREALFHTDPAVTPLRVSEILENREKVPCLPVTSSQDAVEPVWKQLSARATANGLKPMLPGKGYQRASAEPRLLLASGKTIEYSSCVNNFYWFRVPEGDTGIALLSHTARPSDFIGPFIDDRRELGLSVASIGGWNTAGSYRYLDLSSPLKGWHAPEGDARWTTARADLPLGLMSDIVVEITGCVPVFTETRMEYAA